ncbi:thiolase family protein [Rhodococcus sp. IEGM 1305]|uniref:thiolase family protein n=1 Tax=Rhodococcus sp. IEGM 1305 TaxID=3047092 RepID=UPI0024B825C6|nr:thiolase family protein [Rhodococcus sp. IEGM 1305]MDI9953296.1 thiolase family protein [Rhodococcus sp. IEGM 1305]
MSDAVILSACRTAIGTSFKGALRDTHATELSVPVVAEAVLRSGIAPESFDDIVLAESLYGGGVLARYTALEVGMRGVPGVAVNRHCAGGLTSVMVSAANLRGGFDEAIVAGGVQSSSTAPGLVQRLDGTVEWRSESHRPTSDAPAHDMSITVGWNAARQAGITREDMDAWAYRSHVRAVAATSAGQFTDEIVPLKITTSDGSISTFDVDEHPRSNTSVERLAGLRVLHPEIEGFSITAGNSSGINDAAAAVAVASSDLASRLGLTPLAVVRGWAAVGVEPGETGTAAVAAIRKALQRTSLSPGEIDLWEINEAFASVPIAAVRALDLDEDRVNPWGSGCSLGHPVAASGTRMLTTLSHELARRGRGIAVAAMCAGGGMAAAVIIEAI